MGSPHKPSSPTKTEPQDDIHLVPRLTLMDSFNKTSTYPKHAEVTFGTGSRPALMVPTATPGPGAYQLKTTMNNCVDSTIKSPPMYTIRGRTKFGDPNLRALSKTTANEPGPGQYDLQGKFPAGFNPEKYSFPKSKHPHDKTALSPGPGAYGTASSLGNQPLSTKTKSREVAFPKAERPSLVQHGTTEIGPGEYGAPPAACEEQIDSRKPTCATLKFGGGYVKNKNKLSKADLSEPSPGPGSYQLPGGVATKSRGSPYRSSPAATLSGRNKFGSPFAN